MITTIFTIVGAATSSFFGAVACVKLFTGKTTDEAVETVQKKIQKLLGNTERIFDVYSDPIFMEQMKDMVRDYSVLTPEQSDDGSGCHSGLPYYVVQLILKNQDDKEKVVQIMKKSIRDSLKRNGMPDSEVLIDFPNCNGLPGIEGRYACTSEQREMIKRTLELEKNNAVNSGSVRDENLDQEIDQFNDDENGSGENGSDENGSDQNGSGENGANK